MNKKCPSEEMATLASNILMSNTSSKIQKTLAGSVLSQKSPNKVTSKEMETIASHVLSSDKYSGITQSLAASILTQSDKER